MTKWANRSKDSDGKHTKPYDQWHQMRQRCKIGGKWQQKYPPYVGCTHDEAWESYDKFFEWASRQVGFMQVDEKGKSYQLDKDFLRDSNLNYGEKCCVFIPQALNKFLISSKSVRGDYPVGVSYHKHNDTFTASMSTLAGRKVYLGSFKTPDAAFAVYKQAKEAASKALAAKYAGLVDERVVEQLLNLTVNITD